VALSVVSDWRWLRGREDTPWYPTLRLFRQASLGDWESVFARMARELPALAGRAGRCLPARLEVPPGELLDRLTILRIKAERVADPAKRARATAELARLEAARAGCVPASAELARLTAALRGVNEALWDAEDALRRCERAGEFGAAFVELARSVYRRNDERAALKEAINAALGAQAGEPKDYPEYR
jgi:hypothetical protein